MDFAKKGRQVVINSSDKRDARYSRNCGPDAAGISNRNQQSGYYSKPRNSKRCRTAADALEDPGARVSAPWQAG